MENVSRRTFVAASLSALAAQPNQLIRMAIIGTGHRGWSHIETLKATPGFEIVALADPTPEFLDRAATLVPGAARYTDYKKLLAERKDIDAAVVITPNFLHAEVAIAALNRGLDVLCEKPMATTIEDANRMADAATRSGKLLYIGFQKRFSPTSLKMRELVKAGAIGRIQFVSANLFRGDWNPKSWKHTDPETGVSVNWRYLSRTAGSALLEDGIHDVDVLHWIVNDHVRRVTASGGNNVYKDRETIDHAGLLIEYENGVKFSFDFCLFGQNAGPAGRRTVVIGSEGIMQ
ncbi:MAG: Gfo/Idh/MocA family oxidoreductase, partial [Acidobacteria bacterium]|nr:Gfo/Idh/MocA family oxidoreductase [Acidobacteriota bacterium]